MALMVPLALTQPAHAGIAVGIGVGPGYVDGPPVCEYGYYPYYPYACAPYGYYGPSWFAGGIFIGAGPWYHGFGRPFYPGYGYYRGWVANRGYGYGGHGYVGHGYAEHGYAGHGDVGHGAVSGYHGGGSFHGGGSSHSSGGFHGGGRR